MTNYKLITAFSLILISGCSTLSEKSSNSGEQSASSSPDKSGAAEDKAVKTDIDPEVMYMLMAAELAGQREQYDVALEGYLEAAKRVDDVRLAERAAKIALYIKDIDKAEEAVNLWLKKAPDNVTARKIGLLSALRKEDKASAAENAKILLEKDPDGFESSVLDLVKALGPKANLAFIYDVLEDLAEEKPDQADIFYVQSMLAMQLNSKVLAQRKIEQALSLKPDWEKALLFRAQLAAYMGDTEKAKSYLSELAEKYPDNVKVKKMLAQTLMKSSETEQAKKVYEDILDDHPDDAEAKFALALVYLQLEKDDKAEPLLKELLSVSEWQDQASFYLGRIAVRGNRDQEALQWFDKVSGSGFRYDALVAATSLLIKEGKFDEARTRLNNLGPKNPDERLRALLLEVELNNAQQRYDQSFELLSTALESRPDQKELLYARALVAEKLDKLNVLESDLGKILKQNPDDVSALNALGYTLVDKTNRLDEARGYIEKALQLQPDEPVIIDSYGWLQFKLNNLDSALEHLQKAYNLSQENEIAAHLGEVLWKLGRKDEAKKLIEPLLRNHPKDEYLLEFQKRFLLAE